MPESGPETQNNIESTGALHTQLWEMKQRVATLEALLHQTNHRIIERNLAETAIPVEEASNTGATERPRIRLADMDIQPAPVAQTVMEAAGAQQASARTSADVIPVVPPVMPRAGAADVYETPSENYEATARMDRRNLQREHLGFNRNKEEIPRSRRGRYQLILLGALLTGAALVGAWFWNPTRIPDKTPLANTTATNTVPVGVTSTEMLPAPTTARAAYPRVMSHKTIHTIASKKATATAKRHALPTVRSANTPGLEILPANDISASRQTASAQHIANARRLELHKRALAANSQGGDSASLSYHHRRRAHRHYRSADALPPTAPTAAERDPYPINHQDAGDPGNLPKAKGKHYEPGQDENADQWMDHLPN